MKLTFRWYGYSDPVTLNKLKQIPNTTGVVSALYDIPVGNIWDRSRLITLKGKIESKGLEFSAIESIPVHEDIKLGLPERDRYIENYCQSIQHLGEVGIPVLCYNFMPVFDWTRTNLQMILTDGSSCLSYKQSDLEKIDLSLGTHDLPGWGVAYSETRLQELLTAYQGMEEEQLWDNLAYFLEKVIPVAKENGVYMGIHPDDPPWSIFGLPRIITNQQSLQRVCDIIDTKHNGISFCTGSLGADPENHIPEMVQHFASKKRINFMHVRNVRVTDKHSFHESAHPSAYGSLDMFAIMKALYDCNYNGVLRPDHGRMIWGETGKPGYGLYDRALGAMYLSGIWEALQKTTNKENR